MIRNILSIFGSLLAISFISRVIFLAVGSFSEIPLLSFEGVISIFYGIRFDATIAALLTAPIALLSFFVNFTRIEIRPLLRSLAIVAGLWLVLVTMSDAIYASDARKHITFELFTASGSEVELIKTAFISYYHLIILGLLLCIASSIAIYKLKLIPTKSSRITVGRFSAFVFIWLLFSVTAVRGGWMDAPQSPMSAYKIGDNHKAYLAWNAPYSVTYYLANGTKKAATHITAPAPEPLKMELYQQPTVEAELASLKDANIIFVLLESWVSIDMQSYGSDVNATPNFDRLRESSLTSHAMYADGYRTVQGMFASMCSFPNPNGGIVPNTQLQNNQYSCLPQMLKERGWDTRFVQGSGKGIVGAFAQTLGFAESYGKKDYDFDYEFNEWGYMDGGIYRFSLDRIDEMQNESPDKPFFLAINTGTTHGSYLPKEDGHLFGDETLPQIRASVLHHADNALNEFLEQLKHRLNKPTLIVLMSDHTAKITEPDLAQNSIPFLIYATDDSVPNIHHKGATSQRDIGATALDWLGGSAPWFTGQSLLNENYKSRTSFSDGSTYFWVDGQKLVTIDSTNGELQRCYTIGDNTIKLHKADCGEDWVQPLYEQGRNFNELTQELLFSGKTMDYRKLDSIFPQQ